MRWHSFASCLYLTFFIEEKQAMVIKVRNANIYCTKKKVHCEKLQRCLVVNKHKESLKETPRSKKSDKRIVHWPKTEYSHGLPKRNLHENKDKIIIKSNIQLAQLSGLSRFFIKNPLRLSSPRPRSLGGDNLKEIILKIPKIYSRSDESQKLKL